MKYCVIALEEDRIDIVKWFIEKGLNINKWTGRGGYPGYEMRLLDIAIMRKRADAVALLLNAGAEPNPSIDNCYELPLWLAMKRSTKEIVLLLLRHGANIHQRSRDNENPFQSLNPIRAVPIRRLMELLGLEHETSISASRSQLLSFYLGARDKKSLVRHLPVDTLHKHVFPKCIYKSYPKGSVLTPKQRNDMIDAYINSGEYRVSLQWAHNAQRGPTDPKHPSYLGPTPIWCQWTDPPSEPEAPPAKKRDRDSPSET